jgi:hypothetical protein
MVNLTSDGINEHVFKDLIAQFKVNLEKAKEKETIFFLGFCFP